VTTEIRKEIQRDGTYRLDTANTGDVVLTGTIVNLDRRGVSFQRRDTLTARDYRVTLTAQVTARNRVSGHVLFERKVSGHSTIRVADDLPSAERQAIPLVAQDLARNVASLLVDGEW
jgi:Lipopolysaccharide-assembly